jgi:hypothetical protein
MRFSVIFLYKQNKISSIRLKNVMENDLINQELKFLEDLQEYTKTSLLNTYLSSGSLPENYDIGKALAIINRLFHAEIDYILRNPEDYENIYNNY